MKMERLTDILRPLFAANWTRPSWLNPFISDIDIVVM